MSVMFQVRNIPADVHRRLRVRAAHAGLSMSDYVLRLLDEDLSRPSLEEMLDRLGRQDAVALPTDPVTLLRKDRDAR